MKRLTELDFAKGILIYLMVIFHLPLPQSIQDLHNVVYSFHMPGFLILSGFLTNFNKPAKEFFTSYVRKILVPYILFEFIYLTSLFLSHSLNFNTSSSNSFNDFTVANLFEKIFLEPIGTYWYLHTLFIGVSVAFIIKSALKTLSDLSIVILIGVVYWLLSFVIKGFAFENTVFLLLGILLRDNNKFIPKSLVAIIPFLIIVAIVWDRLDRFTLAGLSVTLLFLSFLCALHQTLSRLRTFRSISDYFTFIGKNTLGIVVLSPIITSLSKMVMKYFLLIDVSGFLFLITMSILTVHLSILGARVFDLLRLSPVIFGTKAIYSPYSVSSKAGQVPISGQILNIVKE